MLRARLAEQDAGVCHFHVVVADHGELLGRGVATGAVREICRLAARTYRLSALTARDNLASMAVPARTGFTAVDDITLAGRPGVCYRRGLAAGVLPGPSRDLS
ncbi:ribosomal-protein-alanine N-acetyltransferase [Streptomyces sp. yr375]|uniref:GNAT family N-acetyltransferase n=1 Tax=Streptomyces sp. yr375 TaxID=1761906 RepID=UPI0008D4F5D5|nr:ribosomal-protein-alanine N-acetyltransferase [Streptomyces sp. yr375]